MAVASHRAAACLQWLYAFHSRLHIPPPKPVTPAQLLREQNQGADAPEES